MDLNWQHDVEVSLEGYVKGDVDRLPVLVAAGPALLRECATRIKSDLVVTRAAAMAVLLRFARHEITAPTVQSWASFVRWGLLPTRSSSPTQPIDIDFEAAFEDEIVEVVARLDEIGDLIDGVVTADEVRELLHLLGE